MLNVKLELSQQKIAELNNKIIYELNKLKLKNVSIFPVHDMIEIKGTDEEQLKIIKAIVKKWEDIYAAPVLKRLEYFAKENDCVLITAKT